MRNGKLDAAYLSEPLCFTTSAAMKKFNKPILLVSLLLLTSCVTHQEKDVLSSNNENLTFVAPPLTANKAISSKAYPDVWTHMREKTGLYFDLDHPRITKQRSRYLKFPHYFKRVSERSRPFAHYIISEVERRDMPSELALLPFLESAYKVDARSPLGAEGLWQFMPITAEHLEMTTNRSYDARRDIVESTESALTYLTWLNKQLDNDWLLTLAAYNAGLGTVKNAMSKNRKANKPTTYWDLKLPKETMNYVPHLLALQSLVDAPEAYGVELAKIPDTPYFATIRTESSVDLLKVAEYLKTDTKEILLLNAAYKKGKTASVGHSRLLIPAEKATDLTEASLNEMQVVAVATLDPTQHTVKSGDTISQICVKYDVSLAELRKLNKLTSNKIRTGQKLLIPTTSS